MFNLPETQTFKIKERPKMSKWNLKGHCFFSGNHVDAAIWTEFLLTLNFWPTHTLTLYFYSLPPFSGAFFF